MPIESVEILDEGRVLNVSWDDGSRSRFHAIWLRDNSQDGETRNPGNGQRLITVLDLPSDTKVVEAITTEGGILRVTFEPEMKMLEFCGDWLKRNAYDIARNQDKGRLAPEVETWDNGLENRLPHDEWSQISTSREALGNWLAGIRKYGVALLSGIPVEEGTLCKVVDLFGYVRETNYGRWFDVRSEVNPNNLAYTNLGLQAHTDNPYRDPVPTLQLLSCLENSVEGGESIVIDGFRAVERLRLENAGAFELLSSNRAAFEYSGSDGVCLRSDKPMIELSPDGELSSVRFNNRSAAPLVNVPFEHVESYYAAYHHFAEIIEDESIQVRFKLLPGQLFIVDNTRVLHARTEFSGVGKRWLQGCYADKDSLLSTLSAIEEKNKLGNVA